MPPISELGPDALSEPMTLEEFTESLRKKKTEIKALLLDQVLTAYLYYFPRVIFYLSFNFLFIIRILSFYHIYAFLLCLYIGRGL